MFNISPFFSPGASLDMGGRKRGGSGGSPPIAGAQTFLCSKLNLDLIGAKTFCAALVDEILQSAFDAEVQLLKYLFNR